jgi:hypothetical protein
VALAYAAREDMGDGTPVFDDHHCPSVVFYVGGTQQQQQHRTHRAHDTHTAHTATLTRECRAHTQ